MTSIKPVNPAVFARNRFLDGISRKPGSAPFSNPRAVHTNLAVWNKLTLECWGPDPDGKLDPATGKPLIVQKARVERIGNVANTYGLDQLAQLLSSDTNGASKWCSAMAIGTSSTAPASTDTALGASTQIVYLSQASMVASYPGARTLQMNATFASNGNSCTIAEVGLFGTTSATTRCLAHATLGNSSINRGTADEIRVSYQLVFGTA